MPEPCRANQIGDIEMHHTLHAIYNTIRKMNSREALKSERVWNRKSFENCLGATLGHFRLPVH